MAKALTRHKVKSNPGAAVFARNHWIYLQGAAQRGRKGQTCFRASAKWKSARLALDCHGPRDIYFTPINPPEPIYNNLITHEAVLLDVLLLDELETHQDNPLKNPLVKRYMEHVLEATKDEGLWDGNASSLYLILGCRRLVRPFPYTELLKLADGEKISEDFGYSYSICHELKSDCLDCYFD